MRIQSVGLKRDLANEIVNLDTMRAAYRVFTSGTLTRDLQAACY
jgi:hypothetical protein